MKQEKNTSINEESAKYYQYYNTDPTLASEVAPCNYADLLAFSDNIDKALMILGSIFSLGNGVSLIFYARPLKDLIDAFDPNFNKDQLMSSVQSAISGFLLNSIFVFVNGWLMTAAWTISSQRQLVRARKEYFQSLLRQEISWHDRGKPQQIASQMYLQTEKAQSVIVQNITGLLAKLSIGGGGIIYSLANGWQMALVMMGFLPIMFLVNYGSSQLSKKWESIMNEEKVKRDGGVVEVFENIKTVKYLEGETYEMDRYLKKLYHLRDTMVNYKTKIALVWSIGFFCIIFNYALGFWYGTKLVSQNTFNGNTGQSYQVGDVVSIFFCLYTANMQLSGISNNITNLGVSRLSMTKIINIVKRIPRSSEGTNLCPHNISSIKFLNVNFSFGNPLFNNLNLTINRGLVAIMGTSGNGKTTLVNLIMKFYEPFKGDIVIQSNDEAIRLKDIINASLHERIGYVGQEPVLIGETLRQALGEGLSQVNIWKALQISRAAEFVKEIGLDSEFSSLSGGQKQRIAIARAILRNPQILILDEGTSALDRNNQKELLLNLRNKSNIGFIIMVAHRSETVSDADDIIYLDGGKVSTDRKIERNLSQEKQINANKQNQQVNRQEKEQQEDKRQEEIQQTKDNFQFRYIWEMFRMNKSQMGYYIVGIIASCLWATIFPSFSYILTQLCVLVSGIHYADPTQHQYIRQQTVNISKWLGIISLISIPLTIVKDISFAKLGENLGVILRERAFKNLINREMKDIDSFGRLNLAHLVNNHCQNAKMMGSSHIYGIVDTSATLITGFTIAFASCWQITLLSIILIPLTILAGKVQMNVMSGLTENADQNHKRTHVIVTNALNNLKTVRSLNMQPLLLKKYGEGLQFAFNKMVNFANISGLIFGISQSLFSLVLSLVYYVGALLVTNVGVSFTGFFTATYAVMFSGVQAGCNISFIGGLASGSYATAKWFAEIPVGEEPRQDDSQGELVEQFNIEGISGTGFKEGTRLDKNQGSVQFRNVCFRHNGREDYLFRGLNLKIDAKEKVAIVGESGAGKTTLADLLMKIYRPQEGQILIDDTNTAFFSHRELSQKVAIVSQEPALFDRSVFQNIKYNSSADMQEVIQAARQANALEFILQGRFGSDGENQEGLDGVWGRRVGPKGSHLSGGQKQRIAIARALVRRPRILVLDEATSALDGKSEQIVNEFLIKGQYTQMVIAHRVSTIRKCERVVVLKGGRVVQSGSFSSLVRGELGHLIQALPK